LWLYARHCQGGPRVPPIWEGDLPLVCVQCPVFNEPLVITGLLECVTALHWPADRIEIQVLDDSTDRNTARHSGLAGGPSGECRALPASASHEPGRLQGGRVDGRLRQSAANFFAVFDADFRPAPDFLRFSSPISRSTGGRGAGALGFCEPHSLPPDPLSGGVPRCPLHN